MFAFGRDSYSQLAGASRPVHGARKTTALWIASLLGSGDAPALAVIPKEVFIRASLEAGGVKAISSKEDTG